MDIFMDKLAQKSTAQEIIKANTAADLEELSKLRNQVTGYSECLSQLRMLMDEGQQKLAGAQMNGEELKGLVKGNGDEVRGLRQDVEEIRRLAGQLQEQIGNMDSTVGGQLELLSGALEIKINELCGQLEAAGFGRIFERLDAMEESVHKECVKVYRNVQAVMVEESGKQAELLKEASSEAKESRGRIGFAMVFSILAMLFSLAGVVVQILGITHVIG